MSFGRLLAAGKSLVGLQGGPGRYRESKQARLPKFISPRNPFAPGETPAKPPEPSVVKAVPAQSTVPKSFTSAAGAATSGVKKEILPGSKEARAGGWLRTWGRKLNPLPRHSQAQVPLKPVAQQGELSLDGVRVVRNDLSDAESDGVKHGVHLRGILVHQIVPEMVQPMLPVMAMTAEKLEPVGAAWQRLTTRFFGPDQT